MVVILRLPFGSFLGGKITSVNFSPRDTKETMMNRVLHPRSSYQPPRTRCGLWHDGGEEGVKNPLFFPRKILKRPGLMGEESSLLLVISPPPPSLYCPKCSFLLSQCGVRKRTLLTSYIEQLKPFLSDGGEKTPFSQDRNFSSPLFFHVLFLPAGFSPLVEEDRSLTSS